MGKKPIVVVGGGPVGLMCSLYLARVRKLPVVLIERQPHFGGLYSSIDTGWGVVDHGVHIPQKTGVESIDKLFFDVLPKDDWLILENERKDIAGHIFCDQLDTGSLYPDLRKLGEPNYSECLASLMKNVSESYPDFSECENLRVFFEKRFGSEITDLVFEKISQKIWRQSLDKMSPWAAKLVHLARVVIHNQAVSEQLKKSPLLDPIIGFPDQLNVSEDCFTGQRSALYPKKFGLRHVVEGFVRELQSENVTLMNLSEIKSLSVENGEVYRVEIINHEDQTVTNMDISSIVWTSPMQPLATLLEAPVANAPDAPIPHRVVHLFMDRPPQTNELYWLWSYDDGDSLVRVSSPHAYCKEMPWGGLFPICAEMHVSDKDIGDAEAVELAESQLRERGLIDAEAKVVGASVLPSIRWFYPPTVANCQAMDLLRESVDVKKPLNLILATQNLTSGIFYMPDILSAGISQLEAL